VTTASYAPAGLGGLDEEALAEARASGARLTRAVRSARSWRSRVRTALDPRPLLPRSRGLRRIAAGAPAEPASLPRPR
jgi:hypothetical protein